MKKKSMSLVASALLAMASAFVLTACLIWLNQPEVPQELLKGKEG
ncbi:MAG: cyclic lactone autoinducer peptide [Candidatus Cohnella colombiensis]|uniref:Cyclic lactone autoinducer peptide n=1 Tax=Candidatus Cohnella colombiensis TaxID=3121368 RepID=A0AA95EYI7_9BACL|nr:MAG: cyclic lactone autoinducer peptide [Cohnella sp.]